MSQPLETLILNISILRRDLNITQREVAQKAGIEANVLSRYLSGKSSPGLEQIAKIASALNVTPAVLLMNHDERVLWNQVGTERMRARALREAISQQILMFSEEKLKVTLESVKSLNSQAL